MIPKELLELHLGYFYWHVLSIVRLEQSMKLSEITLSSCPRSLKGSLTQRKF